MTEFSTFDIHSVRKLLELSNVLACNVAVDFNVCEFISNDFLAFPKHGVVAHDVEPDGHSLLLLFINARVDVRSSDENCVVKPKPIDFGILVKKGGYNMHSVWTIQSTLQTASK